MKNPGKILALNQKNNKFVLRDCMWIENLIFSPFLLKKGFICNLTRLGIQKIDSYLALSFVNFFYRFDENLTMIT